MKISASKEKPKGTWGNDIRRLKMVIEVKINQQVMEFNQPYLGNIISELRKTTEYKQHAYNKENCIMKIHLGEKMRIQHKVRIYIVISKATFRHGNETWVLIN
jgi:hypothetical protein